MRNFDFLRAYISPFKPPIPKLYIGKVALGTPYFFPRKWVKATPELAIKATIKSIRETRKWNKNNPTYARREKPFRELYDEKMKYLHAVPKKIGFNFVGLGWKTKWKHDDYRFEYSPMISFVFFKWQIAITFVAPHLDHYWKSWLYYTRETNKRDSVKNRIAQCREKAPQRWTSHNSDGTKKTTDYYDLILKKKWL